MKFKFYMQGLSGEQDVLIYDNQTSDLRYEGGDPVPLSPVGVTRTEGLKFLPKAPLNPDNPGRKTGEVKRLKIQMGLGCNYSCSYCSQAGHREEDVKSSSRDAETFLATSDWIESDPEQIEFWGGEPLLYWKKLTQLVTGLRERFPDAGMAVITNGSLLTRERIDFLKDNAVRVTISHDGPGQALRGEDPFDRPEWVEDIRYLYDTWKLQFNMVLTRTNNDPAAGVAWIRERVQRPVVVNVESIVNVHDVNAEGVMSDEELAVIQNNLFQGMVFGALDDVPILNWKLQGFFASLALGRTLESHGQKCGMDRPDWLAVDLKGNVLTCQNVGAEGKHRIGRVSDLAATRLDTAIGHGSREHCGECPVVHLCYGACMYLDGPEFEQTCRNEKAANLGVLQAALYFLTNKVLVRVEPIGEVKPRRKYIPIVEIKNVAV